MNYCMGQEADVEKYKEDRMIKGMEGRGGKE
jgi:hypothetical protein